MSYLFALKLSADDFLNFLHVFAWSSNHRLRFQVNLVIEHTVLNLFIHSYQPTYKMVKRKRNSTVVEKEVTKEEVQVPLVRASDEPVVKKVLKSEYFLSQINSLCGNFLV